MRNSRWAIIGAVCLLLGGTASSQGMEEVEVVINGKTYASMRDYKLERIKKTLARALASEDLNEYSGEELGSLLLEVRREQITGASSGPSAYDDAEEVLTEESEVDQMEDMLEDYLQENRETDPITIDPEKVKSVDVEP